AAFITQGCPRMIVCGITRPLGRLSPTVGQVPHVLRTRLPLNGELPPRPVRLACVRHAASVRPEPGSNSPMRIQFSSNRTTVLPVVRITSESNPSRHASDRADPPALPRPRTPARVAVDLRGHAPPPPVPQGPTETRRPQRLRPPGSNADRAGVEIGVEQAPQLEAPHGEEAPQHAARAQPE